MTLPLSPRTMDAICLEHVVPTSTGNHVFNAASSSMAGDGLLTEALNLPGVDKYTYVSFGLGMRDALTDTSPATTSWDAGIARPTGAVSPQTGSVRALMYQYFRGIPAEALDRLVERPLFGAGQDDVRMSLGDLGARADMMGLPVEIPIDRLAPAPGAPGISPSRIVHFDASGPTTAEHATLIRVEPARVWDAFPFATAGPDVRAEALKAGYPSGRIVPVDGGWRLGMAPALAEHAHADLLTGGRGLTTDDLTRDGVPPMVTVGSYGDLLAHVAGGTGQYALVEVNSTQVFLATHGPAGDAYLDLGTGTTAVFPDAPEQIRVTTLPADLTPADLLRDPVAAGGVPAPVLPPGGVTRTHTFGPGGSRSVDLVGGHTAVPPELLKQLATAAEAIGQSVVVIGPPRRDKWFRRDPERAEKRLLLRAEQMVFQHLQNGEPAPIVFDYGGATAALDRMAARWGTPVMRQSMGGGLDLDRKWTGAGPDGTPVALPPFKTITRDSLKSIGDLAAANTGARTDPQLASYLSMSLSDPVALRERLTTDGGSLKALQQQITALPADPELFGAHSKLLDLLGRDDTTLGTAVDHLASVSGGDVMTLPDLPTVLNAAPENRAGMLDDLKSVTFGTHDDGAARAVLDAVQKRLAGESEEVVKKAIYDNSVYLPDGPGGRADIVRKLQEWRDTATTADQRAVYDEMALWVTTCP